MRLAKLRLEETGEDVDHRTNTTVTRPRQFRVALRIVVIPRGWLRLSRDRHSCRSKQGRTAGASSNLGPRQPDVARASSRAGALVRPAKLLGRRPSARSRFCAPFEGGCRGSINGSKRALSQKTSGKCSAGLNDAGK